MPTTWRENFRGKVDGLLARSLERMRSDIEALKVKLEGVARAASTTTSMSAVRRALQAGGEAPLNVQGLLGHLAQPQTGGAPALDGFPSTADPITQDGALFVLKGATNLLYRVKGDTEPEVFELIGGNGTVTSVAVSGGTTGLGVTGSPVTSSGTITLTLPTQLSIAGTQVLQQRITGWGTPSSTLDRTTFASYAGQTVSNPPTQAEVQQIDDHLKLLSQHLAALITDLKTHGLIGS